MKALGGLRDVNAYPYRSNDTLVVEGLRTMSYEAREYQLRRLGKYLVLRLVCSERSFCLNDRGAGVNDRVIALEGDSPVACYYFKQVR